MCAAGAWMSSDTPHAIEKTPRDCVSLGVFIVSMMPPPRPPIKVISQAPTTSSKSTAWRHCVPLHCCTTEQISGSSSRNG